MNILIRHLGMAVVCSSIIVGRGGAVRSKGFSLPKM